MSTKIRNVVVVVGVIVTLSVLSGCSTFASLFQEYEPPASGSVARVRFFDLAHVPRVFTGVCVNYDALPAGIVNYMGQGEHDIGGMPKFSFEKDADYVEATVRAGQPVTITYSSATAGDMMNDLRIADNNPYSRVEWVRAPGSMDTCSGESIEKRTFVPESGANYEVRFMSFGNACSQVEIFKIDTSSVPAKFQRVHYVKTHSCDD